MKRLFLFPLLAIAAPAHAALTMFFTLPGESAAITSLTAPEGSVFTFSVWATTDPAFDYNVAQTFIAFDEAGPGLVPNNARIIADGSATSAISNVGTGFELFDARFGRIDGTSSAGPAAYGLDATVLFTTGVVSSTAPQRLFDVTLRNVSSTDLAPSLITLPPGTEDQGGNFVVLENATLRAGATASLSIVPEPASMAVLGFGLAALRRRRAAR